MAPFEKPIDVNGNPTTANISSWFKLDFSWLKNLFIGKLFKSKNATGETAGQIYTVPVKDTKDQSKKTSTIINNEETDELGFKKDIPKETFLEYDNIFSACYKKNFKSVEDKSIWIKNLEIKEKLKKNENLSTINLSEEKDGIYDNCFYDKKTGLAGTINFIVNEKGQKVLVLNFLGTDTISDYIYNKNENAKEIRRMVFFNQLISNINQFLGILPANYEQGSELVAFFKNFVKNNKDVDGLILNGHSLGGGVAQYAGLKNGVKAYCINAAPLSKPVMRTLPKENIKKANELVTHFSVEGDCISHTMGIPGATYEFNKQVKNKFEKLETRKNLGEKYVLPTPKVSNKKTKQEKTMSNSFTIHNSFSEAWKQNVESKKEFLEARKAGKAKKLLDLAFKKEEYKMHIKELQQIVNKPFNKEQKSSTLPIKISDFFGHQKEIEYHFIAKNGREKTVRCKAGRLDKFKKNKIRVGPNIKDLKTAIKFCEMEMKFIAEEWNRETKKQTKIKQEDFDGTTISSLNDFEQQSELIKNPNRK